MRALIARSLVLLVLLLPSAAVAEFVQGPINASVFWNLAGSPYILTGDVTVGAAATLTIESGVQVVAAATDGLNAGDDKSKVELTINGTLLVKGTVANPVVFSTSGGAGFWYGIRLFTKNNSIVGARVNNAVRSVELVLAAQATITDSVLSNPAEYCVYVGGGSQVTLSRDTLTGAPVAALWVDTGSVADMDHSLVMGSGGAASRYCCSVRNYAVYMLGDGKLTHNTIVNNVFGGIYTVSAVSGKTQTVVVRDNIIAFNSTAGFGNGSVGGASVQLTHDHNLIFGHGTDFAEYTANIPTTPPLVEQVANPLLSPSTYALTEHSPGRKAASDGGDLGAFPYAGEPTPRLEGTLFANTSLSGSQVLAGDLIVPPGVTLTIEEGTTLTAAASDEMKGGADPAKVELIVRGTLIVKGTTAKPVKLTSSGGPGSWVGVRLLPGSSGTDIAFTTISRAVNAVEASGHMAISNSTLAETSGRCIIVADNALARLSYDTLTDCLGGAVGLTRYGGMDMDHSLVTRCGNPSVWVVGSDYKAGRSTFLHNTIVGNLGLGTVFFDSDASITIQDNVIALNGARGVSRTRLAPQLFDHNLVWGHTSWDIGGLGTGGAGHVQANPLLVGGGNYALTSASPARKGATDGSDMGAFPYNGDQTPRLEGTVHASTTLSGSQILAGDLTVPAGVTLTLAAGTSLVADTSDEMRSGLHPYRVELIVLGTLVVAGTAQSPVILTSIGPPGSWYGVRVAGGLGTRITGAEISNGVRNLDLSAPANVTGCTLAGATQACILVSAGTATLSKNTLTDCTGGALVVTSGGTANMDTSLVKASGGSGEYAVSFSGPGGGTMRKNTIARNIFGGVKVAGGRVVLRDNVIASNGSYGLSAAVGTTTLDPNLVWGHTFADLVAVSPWPGLSSANPLFVGGKSFVLTSGSPARNAASDGGDLGAFPFAGDKTAALQGTVFSNTTLSGKQTLAGDLTVPSGVTLTLDPDTVLDVAPVDGMGGGVDPARVEIIVSGTLDVKGVALSPVTLTTSGLPGSWRGVRVLGGGSANIAGAVIEKAVTNLDLAAPASITGTTLSQASQYCAVMRSGTTTVSGSTLSGCVMGALLVTSLANVNMDTSVVTTSGGAPLCAVQFADGGGTLHHNTIAGNVYGGLSLATLKAVTIRDNIITANGAFGVTRSANSPGAVTLDTNDLFRHTTSDLANVVSGPGGLFVDPQLLSATDFHLQAGSPCIKASSDGTDLGAFPYFPQAVTLDVSPVNATVGTGEKLTFTAKALDASGKEVPLQNLRWSAETWAGTVDPVKGALTVSCTPMAARGPGVTATANGLSRGLNSLTITVGPVDTISLSTAASTLDAGGTYTVSAVRKDKCGNVSPGSVSFAASAGTIHPTSGAYTAPCAPGTYPGAITATAAGVTRSLDVTVVPGSLDKIVVSPASPTLPIEGQVQFSAVGTDKCGNTVPTTVTWSAPDKGGTVSPTGLFIAGSKSDVFWIVATRGTVSGSAKPNILPGPMASVAIDTPGGNLLLVTAGSKSLLKAKAYDAKGNELKNTSFTWSAAPDAGTIASDGVFTASCALPPPGSGSILQGVRAWAGGFTGAVDVAIAPGFMETLEVSPATRVSPPTTPGLRAEYFNTPNFTGPALVRTDPTVNFDWGGGSPDPSIGTDNFSARWTGEVQPRYSGKYTFSTLSDDYAWLWVDGQALLNVGAGNRYADINLVADQKYSIKLEYQEKGGLALVTLKWRSQSQAEEIIPQSRLFSAPSAAIFSSSVRAKEKTTFVAVPRDGCGNDLLKTSAKASITMAWTANEGSVDSAGVFTAPCALKSYPGAVTVAAKGFGTAAAKLDLTVNAGPLAELDFRPDNPTVAVNEVAEFSVQATDQCKNPLTVTPVFSILAGGGLITPGGSLRAGKVPGVFKGTLKVESGSVSEIDDLTVIPGPASRIDLFPLSPTVVVGGQQTFTAKAYDEFNNLLAKAPIAWTASPLAGAIKGSGVFTAACAPVPTPDTVPDGVVASVGSVWRGTQVTIAPGAPAALVLAPPRATVAVGDHVDFRATLVDRCKNALPPGTIAWSASSGAGQVDSSGRYTPPCGLNTYSMGVKAQSGAVSGGADITVVAGPLAKIAVTPSNPQVPAEGSQAFSAAGSDSCGNPLAITPSWSAAPGVGTIDAATGVLKAGTRSGTFRSAVSASVGPVVGSTDLTVIGAGVAAIEIRPRSAVVEPGAKQSFTGFLKDKHGNVLAGAPKWRIVNGGGTLDASSGELVAATKAGTYVETVEAFDGAVTARATVVIKPSAAVRVTVAPGKANVAPLGTTTFVAKVFDAHDNPTEDPVAWTLAAPAAGTLSISGQLKAGKVAGSYENAIVASVGTISGKATVVIDPGALTELTLSPAKATLRAKERVTFTAAGKDAHGNVRLLRPAFTVNKDKGGGTIDGEGVFVAGAAAGVYTETVRVDEGGVVATATVEVLPGPLSQIAVEPSHPSLKPFESQQFTARAQDAFGNDLSGVAVEWSADPVAGTVTAEGLFTAGNYPGDHLAAVTASAQGVEGKASVEIVADKKGDGAPIAPVVGCGVTGGPASVFSSWAVLAVVALSRRRRAARIAGGALVGLGALLFSGEALAATTVKGTLSADTTWDASGSPYNLTGDVLVVSGVTLTIKEGAQVIAASSDSGNLGIDPARVELIVVGVLDLRGTNKAPVVLTSSGGVGSWYGVRLNNGSANTISNARISKGVWNVDIENAVSASLTNSTLTSASKGCVQVAKGSVTLSNNTIAGCQGQAVYVGPNATVNMDRCLVTSSGGYQSFAVKYEGGGTLFFNTITQNTGDGAVEIHTHGGAGGPSVTVRNNILAFNGTTGLQRTIWNYPQGDAIGPVTTDHNAIFGHKGANFVYPFPATPEGGAGHVGANPLLSPTTFALTSNSPARSAASDGTDMGAFPFAGETTQNLLGTLPKNTQLSGSHLLVGDLTVPAGITLTLAAGTTLTAALTDDMGAGADPKLVEIIVYGTLLVQGTTASPVTIASGGGIGSWYGVRIEAGSTGTTIAGARISKAFENLQLRDSAVVTDSVLSQSVTGVHVLSGTLDFATSTVRASKSHAIHVDETGVANLDRLLVTGGTEPGLWACAVLFGSGRGGKLTHSTVVKNLHCGVGVATNSPVLIRDNVIASNTTYGVYVGIGPSPTIDHNLVWGHASADIQVPGGAGHIEANPLFDSGFVLTANSPARNAAQDGSDLGAFPYAGAPTPELQGTLFTSTTLSGAKALAGDLTVPAGVTLTLAAGTTLTAAAIDGMASGIDTQRVELIVLGTLVVQGTGASPVALTAAGGPGSWYGVRIAGGIGSRIAGATIGRGVRNLDLSVLAAVTGTTLSEASRNCLYVQTGGTATISKSTLAGCAEGAVLAVGGSANLDHTLVTASGNPTNPALQFLPAGGGTLDHCTVAGNPFGAVYLDTTGAVVLRDNVIASNGTVGVQRIGRSSPTFEPNLVWGHPFGDVVNVATGTGYVNANPLFAASAGYALTSRSPARKAASDGTDLGAFPYAGAETPVLQGVLFADTTLKGAVMLAGDLTIPAGVTLKVEEGTTVTAAGLDGMGSGIDPSRVEIIVQGTLDIKGTRERPATLTAAGGAGAWYGVRVLGGGAASVSGTLLSNAVLGLDLGASASVTDSTISAASRYCLNVQLGTASVAGSTLTGCGTAAILVGLSGVATVDTTVITASGGAPGYAVDVRGSGTFTHTTVARNLFGGLFVSSPKPVSVKDSIVASNGPYGVTRAVGSTGTLVFDTSDVFGHSAADLTNVALGAGSISADPLLTEPPDSFRPGAASPCRGKGSGGSDMGAFPYRPPVDRVVIAPPAATVGAGQTAAFTAKAYDASNTEIPGVVFSWTSAAGTITPSGSLTAACTLGKVSAGVTVQSPNGKLAAAEVTIVPGPAAKIVATFSPSSGVVPAGGTLDVVSALSQDACGNPGTQVPVTTPGAGWVAINAGSFLAPCKPGPYAPAVTVTVGGVSKGFDMTVSPGPADKLTITPDKPSVPIRKPVQFAASGADSCANPVVPIVTWSVSGGGLIDKDGLFVPYPSVKPSAHLVTAVAGSAKASTLLTITPGPVSSIVVTPAAAAVTAGEKKLFSAVALDDALNPIPGLTYSWGAMAGTISPDGELTASCVPGTAAFGVTATTAGVFGSTSVTVVPGPVAKLELVPAAATVPAGGFQQFAAVPRDRCGNALNVPVTWSVHYTVGSVVGSGGYTASACKPFFHKNGVTAASGNVPGYADVTVVPGPLAKLTITPSNPSIPVGTKRQFSVVGEDSCTTPNSVAVAVAFAVVGGGGSVDPNGEFKAGSTPGIFKDTLEAKSGSITGTTSVTITPGAISRVNVSLSSPSVIARGKATFTAKAFDAAGNAVNGVTFSWAALPSAGTIDQTGELTAACDVGTVPGGVAATAGGVSGSAAVDIKPGPMTEIEIAPGQQTLPAGGSATFTAVSRDGCKNVVSAPIAWSIDASAGTIDASTGKVTAGCAPGPYPKAVKASAGAVVAAVDLTVVPGPLARILVTPKDASVKAGRQLQFTSAGADGCGNKVATSPVFAVAAVAGSITPGGLLTAGTSPGVYLGAVSATDGAAVGHANVSVGSGVVTRLILSPSNPSLLPEEKLSFVAVALDAYGNEVAATPSFSVDLAAGVIDPKTGELSAGKKAGTYPDAVKVEADGFTASVTLTIRPAAASRLAVAPASARLAPGGTTAFVAQVFDRFDNPTVDAVTWSVSDPRVGDISPLGKLTAGKEAGSFDNAILAKADALVGKASVAIAPGALKELSLSPAKAAVRAGDRVTFTASGKDVYGNAMKVAPVFTVVKGGGAIDGTGVFTAGTRPGIFAETVRAAANGVTVLATVEVTPGPLVLVVVEPSNPSLKPGETQQFTAQPRDAFGNDLAGPVVWSAEPRAGAVTAEGLFTAGETPGDFPGAVTASVETVVGKASVQILSTIDAKKLPGGSAPVVGCAAGGTSAIGLSSTIALWAMLVRRRRNHLHRDGRGAE